MLQDLSRLPALEAFGDWVLEIHDVKLREYGQAAVDTGVNASVTMLSGCVVLDGAIIERGRQATSACLEDLLEAPGQFTAVLDLQSGAKAVTNDFYGFQHLFYYAGHVGGRHSLIVSNRFVSLVHHLRRLGVALTLDEPYLANQIYSQHTFFQQAYSHATACAQVKMVPVDSFLMVHGARARIVKKPGYSRAMAGEGDYETLLDRGAREVVEGLAPVVGGGAFDVVKVSLSGGRDSRIVLGLVLAAGQKDAVQIYTEDVASNPNDLRIASGLVARYGLPWYRGDGRDQFPIDVADGLAIWRHFQSNLYHRIGFNAHISAASNATAIELTGGGGEVYRGFWSQFLRRRGFKSTHADGDLSLLQRFIVRNDLIAPRLREAAEEVFIDAIASLPGSDVLEKSDNHYLYFRNRTHFGGSDLRQYLGNLTWHPLANGKLLAASRLLDARRREEGTLLYDLLERVAPELNEFEYDSGPWSSAVIDRAGLPGREHDIAVPEGDLDAWRSSVLDWKRSLDRARRGPARYDLASLNEAIASEVQRCVAVLNEEGYGRLFGTGFDRLINEMYKNQPTLQRELLSKLYGAVDVFESASPWADNYALLHVPSVSWFERARGAITGR